MPCGQDFQRSSPRRGHTQLSLTAGNYLTCRLWSSLPCIFFCMACKSQLALVPTVTWVLIHHSGFSPTASSPAEKRVFAFLLLPDHRCDRGQSQKDRTNYKHRLTASKPGRMPEQDSSRPPWLWSTPSEPAQSSSTFKQESVSYDCRDPVREPGMQQLGGNP